MFARLKKFSSLKGFKRLNFKNLKNLRNLELLNSFKIVLFLMIFVLIYFYLIAANRYVSTMILNVRSTSGVAAQATGILSLISSTASSNEDVKYLRAFILSSDMLKILDEKIGLRKLYQQQHIDLPYKIWDASSRESYLKYFKSRVRVNTDTAGLLTVEVEAFSPEAAQLIAKTILAESEKFINEISHQSAREQMSFAEGEVGKYKRIYQQAQQDLIDFQNKNGVFDPLQQAQSKAGLVESLDASLAKKEAELGALQSYMNDNAAQIVSLKSEIAALKRQLGLERSKIVANNNKEKLNELAVEFQELSFAVEFASQAYKTALKAYESASVEAGRKIKQLVIIQSPDLPQAAAYPERLYDSLTAFVVLSLLFGIFKFIRMIIQEHSY